MDLDELIVKYDRVITEFDALLLQNTEVAALDLLALTDQRVTQTGMDANGAKFEDYSPAYKKLKIKAGRYRGIVDFTLSGQMLASTTTGFEHIAPASKTASGATAVVVFAGRDDLTRKKLEGNDRNRPGFLKPSKQEIDRVTPLAQKRFEKQIKDRLQ